MSRTPLPQPTVRLVLALLCTAATSPLAAQGSPAQVPAQGPSSPPRGLLPEDVAGRPTVRSTASVNLLGIPFGWLAAEGERAVGTHGVAVGAGVFSTLGFGIDDGDYRFTSAQAKLKYYPSENGLRGFSVGVTAGVASARDVVYDGVYDGGAVLAPATTPSSSTSYQVTKVELRTHARTAPTLGVVLDYNFLVGRRRRFLVGLGVGARRALVSERTRGPLDRALPDGRLQVGFGF